MIIVMGNLKLVPSEIDAFETEVGKMIERVRAEDGCSHYSLLVEDHAAGVINVVEAWRDDQALRVHLAQPWIVEFYNRFSPHLKDIAVKVHDVSGVRQLPV